METKVQSNEDRLLMGAAEDGERPNTAVFAVS